MLLEIKCFNKSLFCAFSYLRVNHTDVIPIVCYYYDNLINKFPKMGITI
jgi:hypothetical protein